MLVRLSIENIALIEKLDLELRPGFHVLTGETGAGKSILIDAVGLILGERADKDLIKTGKNQAWVEAVFSLDDDDCKRLEEYDVFAEDGMLILSRELATDGKSTCRVNGRLVPLSQLKRVGNILVDLHGQHEHQALLDSTTHLAYVDAFGGEPIQELRVFIAEKTKKLLTLREQIASGVGTAEEREQQNDFLRFQIHEIEAAQLQEAEEEELLAAREKLRNSEAILRAFSAGLEALAGEGDAPAAISLVKAAASQIGGICRFDTEYQAVATQLDELYFSLEESARVLRVLQAGVVFDPYRQEEIEYRLDTIHKLKRKYGPSIPDILAFGAHAQAELEERLRMQQDAAQWDALRLVLEQELYAACVELHTLRIATADKLVASMVAEMQDLGMPNAKVCALFAQFPSFASGMAFHTTGLDSMEFLLSTNVGEELRKLAKIASGGEISRIMLAMKSALSNIEGQKTLIFDEIDAGIGGRISAVVGEKMRMLANTHQVLCVTHSAQIAAQAQTHFFIEKHEESGRTFTNVIQITEEARVHEIARMISGLDATRKALAHARDMLEQAERASRSS